MNPACQDLAPLLTLRAAGALDPKESRRVEAHLAECPACRAEADADLAVLGLARLPPPSEAERAAVADLPDRLLSTLHRAERRRGLARRAAALAAIAAAVIAMVALPALSRLRAPAVPPPEAAIAVASAWEAPDPDSLYDETDVLDMDDAALGGDDGMTAALAAVETGDGG